MPSNIEKLRSMFSHFTGSFFGGVCIIYLLLAVAFSIANYFVESNFFGAVYFSLLFVFGLLMQLGILLGANINDQMTKIRKRLGAGASQKELTQAVRAEIATDVEFILGVAICSIFSFVLATYYWQLVSPGIFDRSATLLDISMFVLDIVAKGALFDTMEHFSLSIANIQMNFGHFYYVLYAFVFRLYISFLFIGAVVKGTSLYLALKDEFGSLIACGPQQQSGGS